MVPRMKSGVKLFPRCETRPTSVSKVSTSKLQIKLTKVSRCLSSLIIDTHRRTLTRSSLCSRVRVSWEIQIGRWPMLGLAIMAMAMVMVMREKMETIKAAVI